MQRKRRTTFKIAVATFAACLVGGIPMSKNPNPDYLLISPEAIRGYTATVEKAEQRFNGRMPMTDRCIKPKPASDKISDLPLDELLKPIDIKTEKEKLRKLSGPVIEQGCEHDRNRVK